MDDFDDLHAPIRRLLVHQCPSCLAPTAANRGLLCPRCRADSDAEVDRQFGALLVAGGVLLAAVHGLAQLCG